MERDPAVLYIKVVKVGRLWVETEMEAEENRKGQWNRPSVP